ncbi:putative Ubiquitin carboxyl-terminal hydrolase MINDY-3 [Blattamonas nauphoetae]|uniref:Ubiquitin carboxyl-terminal hydrolase MINDY-3 n=1 Tax=Blattamonas nauphoetae TaxID=2049346 RepID=A0ABQ9X7K9_9EUKA|nr:putative Ubiquitin carboxyl-terminal hydrolase MINDY-3 [Blattamonas nauphoetae]
MSTVQLSAKRRPQPAIPVNKKKSTSGQVSIPTFVMPFDIIPLREESQHSSRRSAISGSSSVEINHPARQPVTSISSSFSSANRVKSNHGVVPSPQLSQRTRPVAYHLNSSPTTANGQPLPPRAKSHPKRSHTHAKPKSLQICGVPIKGSPPMKRKAMQGSQISSPNRIVQDEATSVNKVTHADIHTPSQQESIATRQSASPTTALSPPQTRTPSNEHITPTSSSGTGSPTAQSTSSTTPPTVLNIPAEQTTIEANADNAPFEIVDFDDSELDHVQHANEHKPIHQQLPPNQVEFGPVSASDLSSAHRLLFGTSNRTFPLAWMQGFVFRPDNAMNSFGLVQLEGGPCGVLASVQAMIIKQMKAHQARSGSVDEIDHNIYSQQQQYLLVHALADILWIASPNESVCLAKPSSEAVKNATTRSQFSYPSSSFQRVDLDSKSLVVDTISSMVSIFSSTLGIVSFLLSLLLTHGTDTTKSEMGLESEMGMIDERDYATHELVNLLITGKAHAHCFDGERQFEASDKTSDSLTLQGISSRSDIGFLSIFDYYSQMEVGINLKYPTAGIWVVLYESHYSTIWIDATSQTLIDALFEQGYSQKNAGNSQIQIDLDESWELNVFFYDQFGKQDEEIKLTMSPSLLSSSTTKNSHHARDLTPPLEQVLSTAFPKCGFDWNGTEPIL